MFRNFGKIYFKALQCSQTTIHPKRTTFILRRKTEPLPTRLDAPFPRKLKRKHYYYLLEKDTNTIRQPDLELILLKNIKNIGNAGDVIKARPHDAYELYLLPGVATYATPENLKKYAHLKDPNDIPIATKNLLNRLKETHVPVFMHDSNPWTIEPWHIKLSLRKIGVICNENCLKLPHKQISGPNFDLEKKDFLVYLTVNTTHIIPMRCRIFHLRFSETHFNISFDPKFYLDPINAIFPEEQSLLEEIPLPETDNRLLVIE